MSIASSTGLSSGINYESIISQLRQASTRPISLVNRQLNKIAQQRQSLQTVNKALLDFKSKAETLQSRDAFVTMLATSSDNAVLGTSASASATPGTYSVRVRQMAQVDRLASQGVATQDGTSVVNTTGSFAYKLGDGVVKSVAVTSGMTLAQLRDTINADTTGKVKASIVNDGTTSNPFRLVLTSSETGASNAITITQNDTTLNLTTTTIEAASAKADNTFNGTATTSGSYTGSVTRNVIAEMTTGGALGVAKYKVSLDGGLTWSASDAFTADVGAVDVTGALAEGVNLAFAAGTQNFAVGDRFSFDAFAPKLQSAQDAIIEADGVQVSRSTNSFTDVIPGVTFTPKKVSADAVQVTVVNANGQAEQKIKDLVNAYNSLVSTIKEQTKYDTESKTSSPLFGDSGVNNIVSSMRGVLTGRVNGLSGTDSLNSVGIKMGGDGLLSVDAAKLSAATSKDLNAVVNLFIESGHSSTSEIKYVKSTSDTRIGTHAVNITQVAEQATVIGGQTIGAGGLGGAETLTIGLGTEAMSITFGAGTTIAAAIAQLNTKFTDAGIGITASNDNGQLRFTSTAYGSSQTISVSSTQAAGTANQFGFGTSMTDTGVDVAGSINGQAAIGDGKILKVDGSGDAKGLQLEISVTTPQSSTLTLSRGIAVDLLSRIDALTESTGGLFAVREKGYDARTEAYEKRIDTLTERLDTEEAAMRKKFNALELKLSSMQSQGNYLLTQLAKLNSSS